MTNLDTPAKLNRTTSNGCINEVCWDNATMSAILNRIVLLESNVSRLELENIKLKNEHSDDIYNLEKDVSNSIQRDVCNIPDDVTQEKLKSTVVRNLGQMDVAIGENDIEIVHRLRKPKGSKYLANIIVRFKDRNNTFKTLQNKNKNAQVDLTTISQSADKKYSFTKISAPCIRTFMSSALHREKKVNYIKFGQ